MRPASCCRALSIVIVAACLATSCSHEEKPAAPAPPAAAPAVAPVAAAPFRVTAVDLGSAIGADKRVATPGTTFAPADTIYASVLSEGKSAGVTLAVRWTYEDGQLVSQGQQSIAPDGPAATEFHIAKPGGWPAGKYKVEVTAEGKPAAARDFVVK